MRRLVANPILVVAAFALAAVALVTCEETRQKRGADSPDPRLASLQADGDRCLHVGQPLSDARSCLEGVGYVFSHHRPERHAHAYRRKDRFAMIAIELNRERTQVVRWNGSILEASGRF